MKSSGLTWTDKHLFAYLANPGKHIPGNKMSFAGLPSDQDRANVIAYLAENWFIKPYHMMTDFQWLALIFLFKWNGLKNNKMDQHSPSYLINVLF